MESYGEYLKGLYAKHPDRILEIFWGELTRTFPQEHIKTRPGGGGTKLDFIQPRTVMHRLDEVAGPGQWEDSYEQRGDSMLCTLTITQPNGVKVSKQDAGNCDGTKDEGDNDKGGYSDALKRAAVKFGIGRHLYRDLTGITYFAREADERHAVRNRELIKGYATEDMQARVDARNKKCMDHCDAKSVVLPEDVRNPFTVMELVGYIAQKAIEAGKVDRVNEDDLITTVIDVSGDEEWFEKTIEDYFKKTTKDKIAKYLK